MTLFMLMNLGFAGGIAGVDLANPGIILTYTASVSVTAPAATTASGTVTAATSTSLTVGSLPEN